MQASLPMRCFHRRRSSLLYGLLVVVGVVALSRPQRPIPSVSSSSFVTSTASYPEWPAPAQYNYSKGDVSWLVTPEDFFRRLEGDAVQTQCRKLVWFGGRSCNKVSDDGKLVCLDPDIVLRPQDCVVYSFGVGNDISFDRAAVRFGCQVYMMDPTVPRARPDLTSDNPKFLQVGLSNASYVQPVEAAGRASGAARPQSDQLTLLTYDDVHKLTQHSGAVHYLKMDIEGHEWKALEHIMKNNSLVGTLQIMVELHSVQFAHLPFDQAVADLRRRWLLLEQLEHHGFLRVSYTPTRSGYTLYRIPGTNRTLETCGELFLVRRQAIKK